MKDKIKKLKNIALGSTGIIGLLVIWALFAHSGSFSSTLLPSPWDIFKRTIELFADGSMEKHISVSMIRVVKGFLLAFALALPIGLVIGTSKKVSQSLSPLIEVLRPIPPTAMISLSILWFGIGEASKVFIIAWASFFPMVLNIIGGVNQVDRIHILAAKTLGASYLSIFKDVILRSAVPDIVIGMRNGFSMAFISLVAAELIASTAGIGYFIQEARYMYKIIDVFVGIIVIGLIGFIINQVLLKAEKQLIRWK